MDNPNNLRSTYNKSSTRSEHSNRNPSSYYHDEEEDEYEGDELGEGEEDEGVNDELDDDNDEEEEEEDEEEEEQEGIENGYDESRRRQKKRRIESLVSDYEFAPRKQPSNSSPAEWTDHSTFLLLEAWGDRFMQLGRMSLRSEDWQDVAEKVSEGSKVDWDNAQCRNRLDLLKKKYKKERERMEGTGGGYSGKWGFFKKMDMLLNSSSAREQCGLPCGIDSGEYVFMNPRVYLDRSNGLDEMRDSPEGSESLEDDGDDDGVMPRRDGSASFGLLADSVKKFGEIYEKIESSKRQQMMELEKMRVDFQRELEVQKKQILERAQAEIAKIRGGDDGDDDDDETDVSAENFSG
ncbi:trihelix transcription factor ENAP1-like [Rhododendron vialii]|uniref:trihelix transcription factor ENAP1-like n=1 Tax=Rhododendron vialii TaxID=182163 RepID=UPI00265E3EAC|nr:trihelix transcription factor ENAP1-like [Rhododendron vialii]